MMRTGIAGPGRDRSAGPFRCAPFGALRNPQVDAARPTGRTPAGRRGAPTPKVTVG